MARRLARMGPPTMTIPSPPERKTPPTPNQPQEMPPETLERLEKVRQRLINELAAQEEWDKQKMERIRGMVGRHGLGPARTDKESIAEGAEAGPASMDVAQTLGVDGAEGGRSQARGWKRKGEHEQNDTTMGDEVAPEASTDGGIDRGVANEGAEPQKKKMKMTANGAGGAKDGSPRFKVSGDVDVWMHGASE